MDERHQLDAPHNNELKDIEQLTDRSGMGGVYRTRHVEWEGKSLLASDDERLAKEDKALLESILAVRGRFFPIGALLPVPFFGFALLHAFVQSIPDDTRMAAYFMPSVIFLLGVWLIVSFALYKRVFGILRKYGLSSVPFILTTLSITAIASYCSYLGFGAMLPEQYLLQVGVAGIGIIILSIAVTAGLLFLWTAPRLGGLGKLLILGATYISLFGIGAALLLT